MSDEKKGNPDAGSPPPEYNEVYNPGTQQGYPPGAQQGYPPGTQQAYPPGTQQAYPPGTQQGYPPSGYAYGYSQPGYYNQNQTSVLVAPGAVSMANQPAPPDHMNLAIFVTLCCFWPTGIIAIMKASEARNAVARGDFASAQSSAKSAKQMANISIIAGICSVVFACVIIGIYVGVILSY